MSNQVNNPLSERIMNTIHEKHISMRSRYLILAEKLGIKSILVLTFALAIFFTNLLFYTLKASGNLGFLSLGSEGVFAFFESFPYEFVFLTCSTLLLMGYVWKKTATFYKLRFDHIVIGILFVVIGTSTLLAFSGVNEALEIEARDGRLGFIKPLFQRMDPMRTNHGIIGTVITNELDTIILAMSEKEVIVHITTQTRFPFGKNFTEGQEVHVGGFWKDEKTFEAKGITPSEQFQMQRGMRPPMMHRKMMPPPPPAQINIPAPPPPEL